MVKAVSYYIAELVGDLRNYRLDMNRVFSRKLTLPRHCAGYFFEVLTSTSRLYGDYLTLRKLEPRIQTKPTAGKHTSAIASRSIHEELRIRDRLRKRIESLPCWSTFDPENFFPEENQLRTRANYANTLVLHLPEIYSETTNLERLVREVRRQDGLSDSCLAELLVGLEHLAHHASYCRHALEILSNEDSWRL